LTGCYNSIPKIAYGLSIFTGKIGKKSNTQYFLIVFRKKKKKKNSVANGFGRKGEEEVDYQIANVGGTV
jgi:hypothetical protein